MTLKVTFLFVAITLASCNSSETKKDSEEFEVVSILDNLYCGTGGLTVGPDGYIYLSDFGPWLSGTPVLNPKNRVYKVSEDGNISIYAAMFDGASGSKFDSKGNFYQSNVKLGHITKITPNGRIDTLFVSGQVSPVGIEVDKEDNLYINNCDAHLIRKVTQAKDTTIFCQDSLLNCPNGLTKDIKGNFYASNFYDGNIIKITPEGKASLFATIPGNNNGHVLYHENSIYVIGRSAHQIYKLSMDGEIELFAGSGKRGKKMAPDSRQLFPIQMI
jgi:sugar lactone lactonase YvrE